MKNLIVLSILPDLSGSVSGLSAGVFVVIVAIMAFLYRTVVPTNMVHIVQYRKKTISYGTGQSAGNVYYRWPAWIPFFGVTSIHLPVSNFNLNFKDYEAYDKDRVPFVLDLTAFFRITDTNIAAQRISSKTELDNQLTSILQGAVRKILASHDINAIMTDRATFGKQFTEEVQQELQNWGVEPVKNIELMDIRDAKGSSVIADIMAKKSSQINMESRMEVAKNNKEAEIAEVVAAREVDVEKQNALEVVGKRTAEKDKAVGIAKEVSEQEIKNEQAKTAEKDKAVEKIKLVRDAENAKEAAIVEADQEKETTIRIADGKLQATKLEAQGIEAKGRAEGEAEKAKQLAPVEAQIKLAQEIGGNHNYQSYLVLLEATKAYTTVGTEQAKALQDAEVKIIANGGNAQDGVKNALDLFSTKGGFSIASMLEALEATPQGQKLVDSLGDLFAKKENTEKTDSKKEA